MGTHWAGVSRRYIVAGVKTLTCAIMACKEGIEMPTVLISSITQISYLCHWNNVNICGGSYSRSVMIIFKGTTLDY